MALLQRKMKIHTKKIHSLKKKEWIIKQINKGAFPSYLSLIYSIPRRTIYNWINLDKQGLSLENKLLGRKPTNINPAFFNIVTKEWHKLKCGAINYDWNLKNKVLEFQKDKFKKYTIFLVSK